MLATLCSNPPVTKSHMGKNNAKILPTVDPAPVDDHTARQTSQLHKIPEMRHCRKSMLTFPAATFTVKAPSISPPEDNVPVLYTIHAMSTLPAKLAM